MRDGYSYLYLLMFVILSSFLITIFWPFILVLLIGIVIYYLYIRYKINKEIKKQVNQINENYDYNSWTNQVNDNQVNNKDVIDVEYTEYKEKE